MHKYVAQLQQNVLTQYRSRAILVLVNRNTIQDKSTVSYQDPNIERLDSNKIPGTIKNYPLYKTSNTKQ